MIRKLAIATAVIVGFLFGAMPAAGAMPRSAPTTVTGGPSRGHNHAPIPSLSPSLTQAPNIVKPHAETVALTDSVSCGNWYPWGDTTNGVRLGVSNGVSGTSYINWSVGGGPSYPSVITPAEIGLGNANSDIGNAPVAGVKVCHDRTIDQYFMQYMTGYANNWIGPQLGVTVGEGPIMGWNWDPAYGQPVNGMNDVITASAGGMGPNEEVKFYCVAHEQMKILWVKSGLWLSDDTLYGLPGCVATFYEALGRGSNNIADTFYVEGLCL